jgi:hypothetical protein
MIFVIVVLANVTSSTAIIRASENGHHQVVALLLGNEKVNPSAQDNEGNSCNDLM